MPAGDRRQVAVVDDRAGFYMVPAAAIAKARAHLSGAHLPRRSRASHAWPASRSCSTAQAARSTRPARPTSRTSPGRILGVSRARALRIVDNLVGAGALTKEAHRFDGIRRLPTKITFVDLAYSFAYVSGPRSAPCAPTATRAGRRSARWRCTSRSSDSAASSATSSPTATGASRAPHSPSSRSSAACRSAPSSAPPRRSSGPASSPSSRNPQVLKTKTTYRAHRPRRRSSPRQVGERGRRQVTARPIAGPRRHRRQLRPRPTDSSTSHTDAEPRERTDGQLTADRRRAVGGPAGGLRGTDRQGQRTVPRAREDSAREPQRARRRKPPSERGEDDAAAEDGGEGRVERPTQLIEPSSPGPDRPSVSAEQPRCMTRRRGSTRR